MCQSTARLTRKWRQEDKSFLEHAASSLLLLQNCRLRLFPLPVSTPALASGAGATPLTCALPASLQLGAIILANGCNSITGRHSSSLGLPHCFPQRHTWDTYQYPASHFVFLRATSGLNCQIFPVTRQQLHSLDTMLSPNDLNRKVWGFGDLW